MRFGRKASADTEVIEDAELDQFEAVTDAVDDSVAGDFDPESDEQDWRADGPFDSEEVELGAEVARIDLEALIITPWDGLNLQLQVDEQTKRVLAVTGVWGDSGLEVVLYAAPANGSLATELLAEAQSEAVEVGGTAETAIGPFGPELRRVLPQSGPNGEQMYHVSRVWFAQGPRWLLRGTLLGEAALAAAEGAAAAPFLEFFRNLVVHRGTQPMVPGERMTMRLPEGAA